MWWTCSVTRRKDVKQPADSCQFGAPIILVPLRFCPVSNENPTTSCCLASWMTTTKNTLPSSEVCCTLWLRPWFVDMVSTIPSLVAFKGTGGLIVVFTSPNPFWNARQIFQVWGGWWPKYETKQLLRMRYIFQD